MYSSLLVHIYQPTFILNMFTVTLEFCWPVCCFEASDGNMEHLSFLYCDHLWRGLKAKLLHHGLEIVLARTLRWREEGLREYRHFNLIMFFVELHFFCLENCLFFSTYIKSHSVNVVFNLIDLRCMEKNCYNIKKCYNNFLPQKKVIQIWNDRRES